MHVKITLEDSPSVAHKTGCWDESESARVPDGTKHTPDEAVSLGSGTVEPTHTSLRTQPQSGWDGRLMLPLHGLDGCARTEGRRGQNPYFVVLNLEFAPASSRGSVTKLLGSPLKVPDSADLGGVCLSF